MLCLYHQVRHFDSWDSTQFPVTLRPNGLVSLVSALGFAKAHGATAERATDPEGWETLGRWVKNRQAY